MKSEFLGTCQVATPIDIVEKMWEIAKSHRKHIRGVLDLGAGDGRFARFGKYEHYLGVEIDKSRLPNTPLPNKAKITNTDAFSRWSSDFDLCIGNPPYIRANRLDREWRERVISELKNRTGAKFLYTANLFVYFLTLALLRTKPDGLVIQLIPFEWVSRPSAKGLRDYIQKNKWHVDVYRFNQDVFDRVLTTASITIIDKSRADGGWSYFELNRDFSSTEIPHPSGSEQMVLPHSDRHESAHALRGLSPGGQDIFTLTEHERLLHGLEVDKDVCRCITSLKPLPKSVESLTTTSFNNYYVDTGERCWLIRSDKESHSKQLQGYLKSVGDAWKKYSTCTERSKWYQYRIHPVAPLLVSSGFTSFGPKIVKNTAKVVALGSVFSILAKGENRISLLNKKLREIDFEKQVVSHSNNLKKIEIRQLNSVIISVLNSPTQTNRK